MSKTPVYVTIPGMGNDVSSVTLDDIISQVTGGTPAPQQEPENPGLLGDIRAIGAGLLNIPGGMWDTAREAWRGGDISVEDLPDIEASRAEKQAYAEEYAGQAHEPVIDAMLSMPYSMTTMGASLGAGLAGAAAGPAAGIAAGMGASGTVAKRAATDQFMQELLLSLRDELGRTPTEEEWQKVRTYFEANADRYGYAEAIPEAISNALFGGIMGKLGTGIINRTGVKNSLGRGLMRLGLEGLQEVPSEVVTGRYQSGEEYAAGLRDDMPTLLDTVEEVAPATLVQSGLMGLAGMGGSAALRRLRRNRAEVQDTQAETAITAPETEVSQEGTRVQEGHEPSEQGGTSLGSGSFSFDAWQRMMSGNGTESAAVRRGPVGPQANLFGMGRVADAMFSQRNAPIKPADTPASDMEANLSAHTLTPRGFSEGGAIDLLGGGSSSHEVMPQDDAIDVEWRELPAQGLLGAGRRPALPSPQGRPDFSTTPVPPGSGPAAPSAVSGLMGAFMPTGHSSFVPGAMNISSFMPSAVQAAGASGTVPGTGIPQGLTLPDIHRPVPRQNAEWDGVEKAGRGRAAMDQSDIAAKLRGPDAMELSESAGPVQKERGTSTPESSDIDVMAPSDFKTFSEGKKVRTVSGRTTTSIPRYRHLKKPENQNRVLNKWLLENAIAEAQARGNRLAASSFRQALENPKGITAADWDSAHQYLFDAGLYEQYAQAERKARPLLRELGKPQAKVEEKAPVREIRSSHSEVPFEAHSDRSDEPSRLPAESSEVNEVARSTQADPLGTAHTEYSGRPEEAIEYLLQVKEGHVPAAFHKEGLGDIDLPWGRGGKGGYGVAHIIERRNKQGSDGEAFVRRLPSIISRGKPEKREGFPGRVYVVSHEGNAEAVISLSYLGKDRIWLLTGYEYKKTPSGQRSDDRPVTASGNEQHIPSLHPDGENPSSSERGSSLAQTSASGKTPPSSSDAVDTSVPVPAETRNYGTLDAPNIPALSDYFRDMFAEGHRFRNIGEARTLVTRLLGAKLNQRLFKLVDEVMELGVIKRARQIVEQGKSPLETYRELVTLYGQQPNLGVRTSTSIAQQAYSTPVPIAYLTDILAGVTPDMKGVVYEPTAGNGSLLINAGDNVLANELNHDRAERLRSTELARRVTEHDATDDSWVKQKQFAAAVVANPPFGTVKDKDGRNRVFHVDGFETTEIDQAIMLNALSHLKENGRAAVIIGGKMGNSDEARSAKYNTAGQRAFYKALFDRFNVVKHISLSGELYSKQGAKYPIDIIVIDGHRPTENPVYPAGQVPRMYTSFEELEEVIRGVRSESRSKRPESGDSRGERGAGGSRGSGERSIERSVEGTGEDRNAGRGLGADRGRQNAPERVGGTAEQRRVLDAGRVQPGRDSVQSEGSQRVRPADGGRVLSSETGRTGEREGSRRDAGLGSDNVRSGTGGTRLDVEAEKQAERPALPKTEKAKKAAPKAKSTATQTAYVPSSDGFALGTLVPNNMALPVQRALDSVSDEHGGDIDAYVTRELGYKDEEAMHRAFAGEQVDALGMALHNIARGKGFILGDQTGIGKGRVCAGVIRWARKQGKIPVFVTMMPDLYVDMLRDLEDINTAFRPFLTNQGLTGKDALTLPDGSKLASLPKSRYRKAEAELLAGRLPDGYDGIFTTYSQLSGTAGASRRSMLAAINEQVVFIFDEAHNAGGSQSSVGEFVRGITASNPNGVLYSSATFAKRPDIMGLYNKTDLALVGESQEELEDTMRAGGLAMQQVVSAKLTEGGQYIRREKSFEGATMETVTANVDLKLADEMAESMNAIMEVSLELPPALAKLDKALKREGKKAKEHGGTGSGGASSITFSSVMHNLVAQTTLAIKADAAVEAVKKAVRDGQKPVITLSNTMGSFIAEYAKAHGLKNGDAIELSFRDLFKSYLRKSLEVKVKEPGSKKGEEKSFDIREMKDYDIPGRERIERMAAEVERLIDRADIGRLPVSPIDYIIDALGREGIRAGEITGRTEGVHYDADGRTSYYTREAGSAVKVRASGGFNNGDLDCLVINRSGSTGISLHASEKFADQRRRNMIILQPDLNIDVFMQTLGRVFRTGQVVPPVYQFLLSDMPSEKRPAAVLGKKMASLNANTTASAKGTQSFDNIPDFLNMYGDQAAYELLSEDEEINRTLGYPLEESDSGSTPDISGLAAKLTGRIPLLKAAEQVEIYDMLESLYHAAVELAEANGTSGLNAATRELDAKQLRSMQLTPPKPGASGPFSGPSYVSEYDVKVQGKPFSSKEVLKHIEEHKTPDLEELKKKGADYLRERIKGKDEEAGQAEQDRVNAQWRHVQGIIDDFPVGAKVSLTGEGNAFEGFVTNIMFTDKKKGGNPVAPSSWKIVVDVADARRQVAVPFSKLVDGGGKLDGGKMAIGHNGRSREALLKRFDEAQSASREKRYIVTGNLVEGYNKMDHKGDIISFRNADGTVDMGIVLPKNMDVQRFLDEMPVRFRTSALAEKFMGSMGDSIPVVLQTGDGFLRISGSRKDGFRLFARYKKADGARYYLDDKLIHLVGGDFIKSGQEMRSPKVDAEDMPQILSYLYEEKGVSLNTSTNREAAREITGDSHEFSEQPMASLSKGKSTAPDSTPVTVVDVDPSIVPEFKKIGELVNWLKEYFQDKRTERIESTQKLVLFSNTGLSASTKRIRERGSRETYGGLNNLVKKAVFDRFEAKDIRHPNLGGQEIYYSAMLLDGRLYAVRISLDIPSQKEIDIRKKIYPDKNIEDLRFKGYELREIEIAPIAENYGFVGHTATEAIYRNSIEETGGQVKKIAPVLYREPAHNVVGFTQATGAIHKIRLGVLRDSVKPSKIEEGILSSVVLGKHLPPRKRRAAKLRAAAVQRVVDTLNGRAENAAPVHVVQTANELPDNIRALFDGHLDEVEGVYDPATGAVWMVADNISDSARAAEVWAHEQIGHHGLRGMFSREERRRILNQLWLSLGGMGNAGIRDIAERYGLDPRRVQDDRQTVMEEYVANMAEKRQRGRLNGKEESLWRRIVSAVLRFWNRAVQAVSGREGRMTHENIDSLLSELGEYVWAGRGREMHVGAGVTGSEALASQKRTAKEITPEAEHAAWEHLQKDMAEWGRQVEEFRPDRGMPGRQPKLMDVCSTPDVLQQLGAPALPMTMSADNLAKILSTKADHNLPKELVKQLPQALSEPIMVFESATSSNSFVVLTELKHEGRSVMVAVHLDTERQRIRVNDIASAYKRGNEAWYIRQIEDGRLLYQDKKKSLAWARTNRLQLPRVRRLPARLSENRILTDSDIVKPVEHPELRATAGERPLASLSRKDRRRALADLISEWSSRTGQKKEAMHKALREYFNVDRIDSIPEKWMQDAEDFVQEKLDAIPEPSRPGFLNRLFTMDMKKTAAMADIPEIQKFFHDDDLGLLSHFVALPHWIAKKYPAFARVYERQLKRMDERSSALKKSLEAVPGLFGKNRIGRKDMESLRKILWETEGQEPKELEGVEKFRAAEKLPNGRRLIEVNPEFYEAYEKWVNGMDATAAAKRTLIEIRKSLDADLVMAHNRMAEMREVNDDAIRKFRQNIGHVPNYFPHHRYGKYFVQAKVDGKVVFRQHFDAAGKARAGRVADSIVAAQRGNFPGASWSVGDNVRLPDEVLGAPIDTEAMEQIIRAATSRITDKKHAKEVADLLMEGTADVLKSRGWGEHGIQRKGIPGFEQQDIVRVLYDYKAGLNGWLTKMEAARDFGEALRNIDAGRTPQLWRYTSQYVKDMLRNSDRIDRISGNIKSVAFAWYLGGSIKTAMVNLTQNLVTGIPRLQMDVTGAAGSWLRGAHKAIAGRVTGGKNGLTEEEARLLYELDGESVITDAYMEEIRGQLGSTPRNVWNRFTKILGLPMSEVEKFNRASLALAAFRAARAGNMKFRARRKYGVKGMKADYAQAKAFAADVVKDSHFVYGKSNMPEFLRSNAAGRAASSMFTFRSFTFNMLGMWAWALRSQGREGVKFIARSLGATMALGGVTALPFYATAMALFQAASGDDDDWTELLRKAMPENNLLRDIVCYGLPTVAGVNLGGSLQMETSLTRGLQKGSTPKEVLTESFGDIIGIPYDLLIEKPSKVADAARYGDAWRMAEEAAPVAVKNVLQAVRLHTVGQTTMSGRPINDPGEPGARRLSGVEAVGKALGFQPVSSTKSYAAYAARNHAEAVRGDMLDELTVLALKSYDTGEPAGKLEMRRKMREWNRKMEAEDKPHMFIHEKDVMRRVKARRRENRVTPKSMQQRERNQAVWG